jgi:murein DD-endopeptidase MepM/ murein hydrolase activator NlpD
MRSLIRCLALCLLATAAALPAGAEQPATIASLKAQANQAAAKYAVARATHARLGDQVAALERQLSDLEARLAPLREQVTREAVAVYQGDVAVDAVTHFQAAAAMMRSDRAAHMVSSLTARHMPGINVLLAAKQRIRDRQADLNAKRHEQDVAMATLTAQRDRITHELDALAAAMPQRSPRQPRARASRAWAGAPRIPGGAGPGADFVCPIDGPLAFSDDFGAARGGGRRHMGVDLLSPRGTVNVAVVDGTIETKPWAGGGITIFLRGDDGHTYVYMHLLQIEGAVPRRVAQGDVIALTGSTGHSYGYHTHFEFHPGGGNPVSPYPLLSAACR